MVAILHLSSGSLNADIPRFLIPALGVMMILALWLFPEAGKKER